MLNHLLAGIVALGSLVLFLSGFFFPEVQRKPDLAWSGVALLYALLLLVEGDRTSGGALLGHIASAALILWFGWQTLQQRRAFAVPETQTAIPGSLDALMPFLKEGWGRILVTYSETSAWVQDKLGKEDSGPNVQTPLAPLQDVKDEDWQDSSASASPATESPSVAIPEPHTPEVAVEEGMEAIAAHPKSAPTTSEVLTNPPSAVESSTDPEASLESEQESAPLTAAQTPHSLSEVTVETPPLETPGKQEPLAPTSSTDQSTLETLETLEISHNSPEVGSIAEPTPTQGTHQDVPDEENIDESAHASTIEDYDDTWPPQDPVT
jgi:hypothetical protein